MVEERPNCERFDRVRKDTRIFPTLSGMAQKIKDPRKWQDLGHGSGTY